MLATAGVWVNRGGRSQSHFELTPAGEWAIRQASQDADEQISFNNGN